MQHSSVKLGDNRVHSSKPCSIKYNSDTDAGGVLVVYPRWSQVGWSQQAGRPSTLRPRGGHVTRLQSVCGGQGVCGGGHGFPGRGGVLCGLIQLSRRGVWATHSEVIRTERERKRTERER